MIPRCAGLKLEQGGQRFKANMNKIGGKGKMRRILVIDDDEGVRESFTLALEDTGYLVDTAESGEKGIEMKEKTDYDLIFLDLKMPGMDGVETLREIRNRDKDIPVYIITAFYMEFFDGLKVAEQDGIDFELVRKPIGRDEIVLVAKGVLEGPAVIR